MLTHMSIDYIHAEPDCNGKKFTLGCHEVCYEFQSWGAIEMGGVKVSCRVYGKCPEEKLSQGVWVEGSLFYDLDEECPQKRNFLTFMSADKEIVVHWMLDGSTFNRAFFEKTGCLLMKTRPVLNGRYVWRTT